VGANVSVHAFPVTRGEAANQGILFGDLDFNEWPETCEEAVRRRQNSVTADLGPAVLVADDETLIRSTIIEILRSEGYDAVGVKDGAAAVQCANKLHPDIVLADISMPVMNGVEAAKRIRASLPGSRIICFSGHAESSELLAQAREEGFDFEFLPKPLKPDALIRALKSKSSQR
jgi:CheY-like chemotaxis protein